MVVWFGDSNNTNTFPLIAILVAAIVILPKIKWFKLVQNPDETDDLKIKACPNPSCARCRRYAELNARARQKLPWIIKQATMKNCSNNARNRNGKADNSSNDSKFHRIVEAVKQGPASSHTKHPSRHTSNEPLSFLRHHQQAPTVLFVRGLKTEPIVTHYHREVCAALETSGIFEIILAEYMAAAKFQHDKINESGVGAWLGNDVPKGHWNVLHMLNQGRWMTFTNSNGNKQEALCSHTKQILQTLPGFMIGCTFGNAFFSELEPGTEVEPHCGPTNVRHRLHFPLIVPQTSSFICQLKVAQHKVSWTEGKVVVFDDSLVHAASFVSTGRKTLESLPSLRRVVLIVDLWHPDLSTEERSLVTSLYPS